MFCTLCWAVTVLRMVQESRKEGQEEEGQDGAEAAASMQDAAGSAAVKAAEPSPMDGDIEMRESGIQVCPGFAIA